MANPELRKLSDRELTENSVDANNFPYIQMRGNLIWQNGAWAKWDGVPLNSLIPDAYDYIAVTYVAAGDGVGEIETVTYKTGGSGGTTVATLTLAYDANDKLSSITRT